MFVEKPCNFQCQTARSRADSSFELIGRGCHLQSSGAWRRRNSASSAIALARYGGLRFPSEVLSVRWQDVDWEQRRMRVPSPKTEHQGKESRVIPIFPELRSSRETELARQFPIHVVTGWLGNTPAIALRHYLLTTEEDFQRAAGGGEGAEDLGPNQPASKQG